jgi:radical SAM superfamily enzyme YgiQ (UPF0313 family)
MDCVKNPAAMTDDRRLLPFRRFQEYLPPHNLTFSNPDFDKASLRVLIARLSPFRDVERSIPHLFLFQETRHALPDAFVDLAFFPTEWERTAFSDQGIPYLIGTQSLRSADAFDLVLISNAYTLELINLPYLLLHSAIPLYASQRGPEWPILLLGGSNAMATQAIICEDGDSLVDGIFFGEGEGRVGQVVSLLAQNAGKGKQQALQQAATEVEGLWAAGSLDRTTKAVCEPDARYLPVEYPLLNSAEAHIASLQINYGCPAFCSFCFEGYDRKPYREIPLSDLLDAAQQLKQAQGVQEISLYSFNANTHRAILPLLLELHELFHRVSLKSQRVDILQHAGYLLEAEVEADKRSFTLGIEGISERQRAWLHKSLPTADIVGLLERLFGRRIREVKLFYILTGHETEDDIAEFRGFVRQVKAIRRARNPGIRVVFSFGLLIRMPFTPLRYDRLFLEEETWRPLIGQCKSSCETNGFEFRLAFDWQTYCVTQVLALGGYWSSRAVVDLAQRGHCFEATLPEGYWEQLRAWMVQNDRWSEVFLGEKGSHYAFALDFVQSGIDGDFLYRQYQQAREGVDSGYCLGSHDQHGRCLSCGACVDAAQRQAITEHTIEQPQAGPYLSRLRDTVARKRRLQPLHYVLRLDELQPGVEPAFLNTLAFKALLDCYPELTDNLLAVRESLFTVTPPARRLGVQTGRVSKRGQYPTMSGESVFALYAWDTEALQRALSESPARSEPWFGVVRQARAFTPGVFVQLYLDIYLPGDVFDRPRRRLEAYLGDAYVPYSMRREQAGAPDAVRYRFDVPAKGLKKKVVLGGYLEMDEDGFVAGLEVGPRFDLLSFLEQFGHPSLLRYAKLHASHIRW